MTHRTLPIPGIAAIVVLALAAVLFTPVPAFAIKQFQDQFKELYVKPDGTSEQQAFAELVKSAKCNVCHEGKSKKNRNAYGEKLSELLDKKADKKDVDKIRASLEKVAGMKSPEGPTFGELIAEGKLPGGPVE